MFELEQFEEVVALAGVRKVRTQEGVKFYGLPLGSPITADLIALKDKQAAAKGVKAPKDALTSSSSRVTPKAPGSSSVESDSGSVSDAIKVKKSTISGPAKFSVGAKEYGAPSGSKFITPQNNPKIAYVRTPDGKIRAFNEQGEIEVPATLSNLLAKKFTAEYAGDDAYEVVDLVSAADDPDSPVLGSAADAPAETVAVSTEGDPVFTKNDQGGWTHDALGVEFSDEDVQTLVDNGEILLSPPVEGDTAALEEQTTAGMPNFSDMTKAEAISAFDAMPAGSILGIAGSDATISKQSDGTWISKSGMQPSGNPVTTEDLALVKSILVSADKEYAPDVEGPSSEVSEVKEAESPSAPDNKGKVNEPKGLDAARSAISSYTNKAAFPSSEVSNVAKMLSMDEAIGVFDGTYPLNVSKMIAGIDIDGHDLKSAIKAARKTNAQKTVELGQNKWHNEDAVLREVAIQAIGDNSTDVEDFKANLKKISTVDPLSKTKEDSVTKENKAPKAKSAGGSAPVTKPTPASEKAIGSESLKVVRENEKQSKQTVSEAVVDTKKPAGPPRLPESGKPLANLNEVSEVKAALDLLPEGAILRHESLFFKYTKDASGWWVAPSGSKRTAASFFTAKDQMVLELPRKEADKPKAALTPEKTGPDFKVGEQFTFTSYEDLDALPAGAVLGKWNVSWTKVSDNAYLTENGTTVPNSNLLIRGNSMQYKIVSLPEPAATKFSTEYAKGDKIKKYGHLREMPVGTKIKSSALGASYLLTKGEDGKWHENENGVPWSPDTLADDIIDGNLTMEASGSVGEQSDDLDVQLLPNGIVYSKKQIADAVDALEGHSGFQIAYGFKTIPDHPLAQKDAQNAVKEAAMAAFPDLKPKQAFVAFLKDKGGISDVPASVDAAVGAPGLAGNKIHLGADNPQAKTIQGYDGGDFTPADVESAISILEAFGGKAFKAELNKKGNPLGILNPNDLVGFNKDKTVTKQKFIDLLKSSLADYQENAPEPEPVELEQSDPVEASKTLSESDLQNLPSGSIIVSDEGWTFTKHGPDYWIDSEGEDFFIGDLVSISSGYTLNSKPAEPEPNVPDYAKAPEAVAAKTPQPNNGKVYWDGKKASEAPEGAQVQFADKSVLYKTANGKWSPYNNGSSGAISDSVIQSSLDDGGLTPSNNEEPLAEWEKELLAGVTDLDAPIGGDPWDGKNAADAPVGAKVHSASPMGSYWQKREDGEWQAYWKDSGEPKSYSWSEAHVQGYLESGMLLPYTENKENEQKEDFDSPEDAETGPQTNPSGLTPGKYSTGKGKAYMVVAADGTAIYVQGNGVAKYIDTDKVKKNYDAGMSTYGGLVDAPEPSDPADKKPVAKAVKKGPVELPSGTYYLGDSTKSKTTVYVVDGDKVKIYKGKETWSFNEVVQPDDSVSVEAVPLDKIKTAYHQGKIVDADGNSVVPKGYSGPITMFNVPTSTQALVMARKSIQDDPEFKAIGTNFVQAKLKALGFTTNLSKVVDKIKTEQPDWGETLGSTYGLTYSADNSWHEPIREKILAQMDALLEGAETTIPESNASGLFEWGQDGSAQMPLELASMSSSSGSTTANNAKAKAIAQAFGGGKILYPPTGKYEKYYWLQAFEQGNFAVMYQYEVNSFAGKDKSHPAGYLHPGYEGNEETNHVKWGAVVSGEVAAGVEVEGDWSKISVNNWSPAEIDNYLIAAKMQNPQYLTLAQKRKWVQYHKNGGKGVVDAISASAAQAKNEGKPALSPAPAWTDDIVPATEYDHMFDEGPYPSGDKWQNVSYAVVRAWAKDNLKNEEFLEILKAAHDEQGYHLYTDGNGLPDMDNLSSYPVRAAVSKYWNGKYEAYQEELNKPVYTKIKLIEGEDAGTHDVWITKDQFDRKYVFKPVDSPDKRWRAEIETIASQMSVAWGFRTPNAQIMELDGEEGILMSFADHVSSFKGKNGNSIQMSSLTEKQVGQVAAEHVLDWILDNDDTHSSNLLMGTDGNVIGIDKGRAFFVYGNWNGLSADTQAHSNANLVYTKLYDDIRSGKVTQEQAQAAYFAAMKAAKRIQNSDDAAAEARIREATANRPKWSPPGYMTHFSHAQAPQNQDQLVAAFLERKQNMVEEIGEMWDRIFAASPYDKPEAPDKALGEDHFSGWEEPGLAEAAVASKVWGTSALHASPGIQSGASLLWHEKTKDDKDLLKGTLKVGNLTQKKILGFMKGKAGSPANSEYQSSQIDGFPHTTEWKSITSAAGKDASKHVEDKEYTAEVWDNLATLDDTLDKDLEFWAPDLEPDEYSEYVFFPSGKQVPVKGLFQYRQALDHYKNLISKARTARDEGKTTDKYEFTVFSPTPIKKNGQTLTGPDGESYTEMYGSGWFHTTKTGVEVVPAPPEGVLKGTAPGWENPAAAEAPMSDPVIYKQVNAHEYGGELLTDGTKKNSGSSSSSGHDGQQYEATLPTGEVITFRNGDDTLTSLSQQGRITYTLSQDDPEASLLRVQAQFDKMGLDMSGAQPEDAENVYWRSMFSRVLLSKGGGAKIEAARNKINENKQDISAKTGVSFYDLNEFSVVEGIGLSMTSEQEHEFWHNLAVETWGSEKVNDWIAADKHLPQYQHLNLADPEMNTGMPYFNRLDVDVDELKKTKTLVAIGNNGKDDSLLKYITSGGMASTEERLRLLGHYKTGASSSEDQDTGGATGVFTRLAIPGGNAEYSGSMFGSYVAYWSPEVLTQTGTYSYTDDSYGRWSSLSSNNKYDPVESARKNTDSSNETLVQNTMSIFDYLEVFSFENATKRNEAIQRMKALGFSTLRGMPIEDRFVMRENIKEAVAKVRASWNV